MVIKDIMSIEMKFKVMGAGSLSKKQLKDRRNLYFKGSVYHIS